MVVFHPPPAPPPHPHVFSPKNRLLELSLLESTSFAVKNPPGLWEDDDFRIPLDVG